MPCISAAFLAAIGLFSSATPAAAMIALLAVGGFFRSLQFTSINTIGYADLEAARMSQATPLISVGQQLSISTEVAIGALVVEVVSKFRAHPELTADDFSIAFYGVALIAASAALIFARMPREAGAEMANRLPPPKQTEDRPADSK